MNLCGALLLFSYIRRQEINRGFERLESASFGIKMDVSSFLVGAGGGTAVAGALVGDALSLDGLAVGAEGGRQQGVGGRGGGGAQDACVAGEARLKHFSQNPVVGVKRKASNLIGSWLTAYSVEALGFITPT